MPERLQFDEAIQFVQVRLKVHEPELKQGKVEMVQVKTARGVVERPWGEEGGFAIVYKFRTKSGRPRALRCFKVKLNPDTQFRYERLGAYFRAHVSDITAGFTYHDTGILVKEQLQDKNYSILDMEWIEGVTLLDNVDDLCKQRDRATLGKLADQWLSVLRAMSNAQIAHGDLAGNNVMVRPDGRLVLIDYDGMYIPDFAHVPSAIAGQPDYQHPQFGGRKFDEWMDAFSAMVIYIALLIAQAQPDLWAKYVKRDYLDAHMIFKHEDFKDHTRPLWYDLDRISDARVKTMVQALKQACKLPADQVRFPFNLIDPDFDKKQPFALLEQAIKTDDDERIAKCWVPPLEQYAPAQQYRNRVELAQKRVKALTAFRDALKKHNIQQIVAKYDSVLDGSKNVTRQEQEQLRLAHAFVQAYNADDDDMLINAGDEIQNSQHSNVLVLTHKEQQRMNLARQRSVALTKFRLALNNGRVQEIVSSYDAALLDSCKSIHNDERNRLTLARNFVQAFNNADDDDALLDAYNEIESFYLSRFFAFTPQERQRVELAQQHKVALARFLMALDSKKIQQIVTSYDESVLGGYKGVTSEDRERLQLARDFAQAYNLDRDDDLVGAYDAILSSPYARLFAFTSQEEQRVQLARQYAGALAKFRQGLATRNAFQIAPAYDPVLDDCRSVTREERDRWQIAKKLAQACNDDDDSALAAAYQEIQNFTQYRQFFVFTSQEQQRLQLALQRQEALVRFQVALIPNRKSAQKIIAAYDAALLDDCKSVSAEERVQLKAAQDFMQMYQNIQDALKANSDTGDNDKIVDVYDEELAEQYTDFTPEQQSRINQALNEIKLEHALQLKAYGLALHLAQEIEKTSGTPLNDFRLNIARQKFIRQFDAQDLQIRFQGDEIIARWQWPEDDLVQYAAVAWRTDRWPQHPKKSEAGTYLYHVHRSTYEHQGRFQFTVGRQPCVYVQVYLALGAIEYSDYMPPQTVWFYSNGDEPTSKKTIYNGVSP